MSSWIEEDPIHDIIIMIILFIVRNSKSTVPESTKTGKKYFQLSFLWSYGCEFFPPLPSMWDSHVLWEVHVILLTEIKLLRDNENHFIVPNNHCQHEKLNGSSSQPFIHIMTWLIFASSDRMRNFLLRVFISVKLMVEPNCHSLSSCVPQ